MIYFLCCCSLGPSKETKINIQSLLFAVLTKMIIQNWIYSTTINIRDKRQELLTYEEPPHTSKCDPSSILKWELNSKEGIDSCDEYC